jgi:hypothetical protein
LSASSAPLSHGFGNVKKNVAPRSSAASAQMRPPCRSMIRRTVASPFEFARVVQALKNAEQLARVFHLEAHAVVAHENHGPGLAFFFERTDLYYGLIARTRILQRVRQQIDEHQAQQSGIAIHLG